MGVVEPLVDFNGPRLPSMRHLEQTLLQLLLHNAVIIAQQAVSRRGWFTLGPIQHRNLSLNSNTQSSLLGTSEKNTLYRLTSLCTSSGDGVTVTSESCVHFILSSCAMGGSSQA